MKGLIGFFDILGYQNFLENNSATDSALKVLEMITEIPEKVKTKGANAAKEFIKKDTFFIEFSENFNHLVFSDTVVFTVNYPENAESHWIFRARHVMSYYASLLFADMFRNGLPLRGVIHEGDFIFKEMCFAGKGIVEAYRLCESLDMSGLVYSEQLGSDIEIHRSAEKNYDKETHFLYLTPIKGGKEIKLLNVNWLDFARNSERVLCEKDVENFVLKSFWAHQKDCSNSVDVKVRNTVKVLRKMLLNLNQVEQNTESTVAVKAKPKVVAKAKQKVVAKRIR